MQPWNWTQTKQTVVAIGLALLLSACGGASSGTPEPAPTSTPVPPTATPRPVEPTAVPVPEGTPVPAPEVVAPIPIPPEGPSPVADAIDSFLATVHNGAPFRGSVLVARNGEVLLNRGYGLADDAQGTGNGPETRFRLGSLTKPVTAIAVLLLQAEGLLDLEASVCSYLPDCPPAWQPITLHHLLSHTSGIPDLTRFPDFEATKGQPSTPAQTMARFADHPLDFAPGTRWDYSNSNYIVLGRVIEAVTGEPYAAVVHARIFAPLGMDATGYETGAESLAAGYRPDGAPADFVDMSIPFAAGALYSTVEDLYRLDRALVRGDLLPGDLLEAMFRVHASIPGEGPGLGYGYGWVVEERPDGTVIGHNGSIEGFSAGFRREVAPDLLIIALSNEERRNPNAVLAGIAAIVLDRRQ